MSLVQDVAGYSMSDLKQDASHLMIPVETARPSPPGPSRGARVWKLT